MGRIWRFLKRVRACLAYEGDPAAGSPMQRYVAGLRGCSVDQLGDTVIVSAFHFDRSLANGEINPDGTITQKHRDEWGDWPKQYQRERKA